MSQWRWAEWLTVCSVLPLECNNCDSCVVPCAGYSTSPIIMAGGQDVPILVRIYIYIFPIEYESSTLDNTIL